MIIFFLIFFRFMYTSVLCVRVRVCVYLFIWTTGMPGTCGGQKNIGSRVMELRMGVSYHVTLGK